MHLRILYALGPGDIVDAYRLWKEGKEAPFEMSIAFSKTFLNWCESVGAQAHLISCNSRREICCDGRYVVENRPRPRSYWASGVKHHFASVAYGLTIVGTALRERPDLVIIDSGTTHWIVMSLLTLMRVPVIAVMHSTLWPAGFPPEKRSVKLLRLLDGQFFRSFAAATVCVSPECERQVRRLTRDSGGPIFQCRAQFRRGFLDTVPPPPPRQSGPFRVLFVGRVEENKGVFLIPLIADQLEKEMPGQFIWKIVGTGSASPELARRVEQGKLGHLIDITGRLSREETQEAYGWAHAVVVPTTAQYNEGLAMTAAEAVLSGRPVILSTVVPAWEVLGDAAILAQPGDVQSFVAALRELAAEPSQYDAHLRATATVQEQFYDVSQGLGAVLGRAISTLAQTDLIGSSRATVS
jgi:glycosyltransferase involved in cell wall biosynthesis